MSDKSDASAERLRRVMDASAERRRTRPVPCVSRLPPVSFYSVHVQDWNSAAAPRRAARPRIPGSLTSQRHRTIGTMCDDLAVHLLAACLLHWLFERKKGFTLVKFGASHESIAPRQGHDIFQRSAARE